MLEAIQRLILIIFGTLFLSFLAVVIVRRVGTQQIYSEPPHPWYSFPDWTVLKPQDVCTEKTFPSGAIVWLPVKYIHQQWRLKCENDLTLKARLESTAHANWLLFVEAVDTAHLDSLVEELGPFEKNKNFGVISRSQVVARYLRKRAPQWVYGADAASLLRLHMFASFWVESAFDFWPDFILQVPGDHNAQLSERERTELARRKKRVIKVEFTD